MTVSSKHFWQSNTVLQYCVAHVSMKTLFSNMAYTVRSIIAFRYFRNAQKNFCQKSCLSRVMYVVIKKTRHLFASTLPPRGTFFWMPETQFSPMHAFPTWIRTRRKKLQMRSWYPLDFSLSRITFPSTVQVFLFVSTYSTKRLNRKDASVFSTVRHHHYALKKKATLRYVE